MVSWKHTPEETRDSITLSAANFKRLIIRIGYTPNFVITSDHRGLFIDLNADSFLGGDPSS
jgi:hypothetical protein